MLVTCIVAAVVAAQSAPPVAPAAKKPRSILFYLVDTCRADHLSVNGYGRSTTPFLEELAARGVRFENCFSQAPWTKPSVASILTSCYPTVTGMHQALGQLDNRFTTLPEALKNAGWYTVGFSANPLMGRLTNYNQGFRRFVDSTSVIPGGNLSHYKTSGSAKALNQQVLPWIAQNAEWPYFLYVHSVDPHEEYAPAPEYLKLFNDPDGEPEYRREWQALLDLHATKIANYCTKEHFEQAGVPVAKFIDYGKGLYDADIRANDDEIARLVAALREKKQLDDMILVVTADHGEEFMEHGGTSHAVTLWNELIHVPLIVVAPGLLPEGMVVKEPVQSLDLYPTLIELVGVPQPDGLQGKSFAPLLRGEPGDGRPIFSENHEMFGNEQSFFSQGTTLSVIRGPWKLILNLKSPANREQPRRQLFRIDEDFAERRDRAAERPEIADRLEALVLQWWTANRARNEEMEVGSLTSDELREADPETLEQLRKLGYIR